MIDITPAQYIFWLCCFPALVFGVVLAVGLWQGRRR
jgi:hypothetical protein